MKFQILAFTALLTLFTVTPLKAEALPDSILPESKVTTELSPLKGYRDGYSYYRNSRGRSVRYGNSRGRYGYYGRRRGRSVRYGNYRGRYGRYGSHRSRSVRSYGNFRGSYGSFRLLQNSFGTRRSRSVGY